ncbi:Ig-like domain-containing protein [Paucibacter sp. O1-1]|nr:Ig-like domain-containing protein [Paucibacter sp. O1-1]MDA3829926.1 Ig-like domain-containing protein [Paucibacter sp. O1-1]
MSTSNANGVATAALDAGSDKSNRTAVVTVVSGAARQTLNVPFVNTKLAVSGATTLNIGTTMQLTYTATDSKGVVIPGVTLGLSSTLGNGLPASASTDAAGQAVVTYTATKSGADSVTVTGAGASVTTGSRSAAAKRISPSSARLPAPRWWWARPKTSPSATARRALPQSGVAINLAATIGVLGSSSVVTDATGQATVSIVSGFAGSSVVSATLAGSAAVQGTLPLSFIATTPASLVLGSPDPRWRPTPPAARPTRPLCWPR